MADSTKGNDEPHHSNKEKLGNTAAPLFGLKKTVHGVDFQFRLLTLFLVRGFHNKCDSFLWSERPDIGGKFDDLIFRDKENGKPIYRLLQAKHKQGKTTAYITEQELFGHTDGDFSMSKYLHSYCNDIDIPKAEACCATQNKQTDNFKTIKDCIICTNIDFDRQVKKNYLDKPLKNYDDKILKFDENGKKKTLFYRFKRSNALLHKKIEEHQELQLLAEKLFECSQKVIKLTLQTPIIKNYYVTLIEEKVIDKTSIVKGTKRTFKEKEEETISENENGKIHNDFIEDHELTENAKNFRDVVAEMTFVKYWKKVKFVSVDDQKDKKKKMKVQTGRGASTSAATWQTFKLPPYNERRINVDNARFVQYCKENVFQAEKTLNSYVKLEKFVEKLVGEKGSPELQNLRENLKEMTFKHLWSNIKFNMSKPSRVLKPEEGKTPLENRNFKRLDEFLDKLVFAVNVPNENELAEIIKKDIGEEYNLYESTFLADHIFQCMSEWFKNKESQFMSSETGLEILRNTRMKMDLLKETNISREYQNKLNEFLSFNDTAVRRMAEKLKDFLNSPHERIIEIATPLPKRTAVKVFAALKSELLRESFEVEKMREMIDFQKHDSYLAVPSNEFIKKHNEIVDIAKTSEYSHRLIVVYENEDRNNVSLTEWSDNQHGNVNDGGQKFVIIRYQSNNSSNRQRFTLYDEIAYADLSDISKMRITKETFVNFQDTQISVNELLVHSEQENVEVDDVAVRMRDPFESVLNWSSIEALLQCNKIDIRSPEKHADVTYKYVKRKLSSIFPLTEEIWREIATDLIKFYGKENTNNADEQEKNLQDQIDILKRQLDIDEHGNIDLKRTRDVQLYYAIKRSLSLVSEKSREIPLRTIDEKCLATVSQRWEKRAVIIRGVAGAGKSTILNHYYADIKRNHSDHWVIKVNLVDHWKAISNFTNVDTMDLDKIVQFFASLKATNSDCVFSNALLRYRLETGDRIVIMLDGFDEIHSDHQKVILKVIKNVTEKKLVKLYVTTRSHMADDLHFDLSQLSYKLEDFTKDNQIEFLIGFWKLTSVDNTNEDELSERAKSLVDKLSNTLREDERTFIGIPLHCRIVAECYDSLNLVVEADLSLSQLYKMLIAKKMEIYKNEKLQAMKCHPFARNSIDKEMEGLKYYLMRLAIETVVLNEEEYQVIMPSRHTKVESELQEEEKGDVESSVRFGLLVKNAEGKEIFLHKTYAEYFFADYLYKGFRLDDDNKIFKNSEVRLFVVERIFFEIRYVGLRLFLNSMLQLEVDNPQWQALVADPLKNGLLPDRFFELAKCFENAVDNRKFDDTYLYTVLTEKRSKIFGFICNCLKGSSQMNSGVSITHIFRFKDLSLSNDLQKLASKLLNVLDNKAFESYLSLCNFLIAEDIKHVIKDILYQAASVIHNGLQITAQLNYLISLLQKHLEKNQGILEKNISDDTCAEIICDFSISESYKNVVPDILHAMFVMCFLDDKETTKLIEQSYTKICKKVRWPNEGIASYFDNVYFVLKRLNRHRVLEGVAHKVLISNPRVFQTMYSTLESIETDLVPLNTKLQLENDVSQMTIVQLCRRDEKGLTALHRMAFDGDTENFGLTLKNWKTLEISMIHSSRPTAQSSHCLEIKPHFLPKIFLCKCSPLYVAAARGNQTICMEILNFLTRTFRDVYYSSLLSQSCFVKHAILDAIELGNTEVTRTLLQSMINAWGRNSLLCVYMFTAHEKHCHNFYFAPDAFKIFFKTVISIVVQNDNVEEHQFLFEFFFNGEFGIGKLQYVEKEIFQKILRTKKYPDWIWNVKLKAFEIRMKGLIDKYGIYSMVLNDVVIKQLLKIFDEKQQSEFVEFLLLPLESWHPNRLREEFPSDNDSQNELTLQMDKSYWVNWLKRFYYHISLPSNKCNLKYDIKQLICLIFDNLCVNNRRELINNGGAILQRVLEKTGFNAEEFFCTYQEQGKFNLIPPALGE